MADRSAMPTTTRPGTKQQQAVKPRPFRIGVQAKDEIDYDVTLTGTTSTQDLPVLNLPPAGFLRGLYVIVDTTAANTGTVSVAFREDAPFNVLETISLEDVNNQPIVGPLSGHDLALINIYGGYTYSADPRKAPSFAYYALSGVGTTAASPSTAQGGAYSFILRIPVELTQRDGLGSLPNKSGTSMFKLRMRLNTTTNVYATAPGSSWVSRVRVEQVNWWDPPETDLKGRSLSQAPPAVQTTQYWTKQSYTVSAGQNRQSLQRVGFLIRNLIFILRDTSGTRSGSGDSAWPDPFTLQFEAVQMIVRIRSLWLKMMAERYGQYRAEALAGGTAGADVDARPNAVYVEPFTLDFGLQPGGETRMGYLPTSAASRLEVQGTLGTGAGTLTVLTNDVAPANGDDFSIVGRWEPVHARQANRSRETRRPGEEGGRSLGCRCARRTRGRRARTWRPS
jgi:hypothetical protein